MQKPLSRSERWWVPVAGLVAMALIGVGLILVSGITSQNSTSNEPACRDGYISHRSHEGRLACIPGYYRN